RPRPLSVASGPTPSMTRSLLMVTPPLHVPRTRSRSPRWAAATILRDEVSRVPWVTFRTRHGTPDAASATGAGAVASSIAASSGAAAARMGREYLYIA